VKRDVKKVREKWLSCRGEGNRRPERGATLGIYLLDKMAARAREQCFLALTSVMAMASAIWQ